MGLHALLGALLLPWVARWFMLRGIATSKSPALASVFRHLCLKHAVSLSVFLV
jgi:hypothetical protein